MSDKTILDGKSEWMVKSGAFFCKPAFQREERYLVLEYTDIAGTVESGAITEDELSVLTKIAGEVEAYRMQRRGEIGKFFKCVVVESDWPEYELVWKMIEDRMRQAR